MHAGLEEKYVHEIFEKYHTLQYSKISKSTSNEGVTVAAAAGTKFGWIKGVLVRCLLNIWGVMLFLRISWIVGEAGIGHTILIIILASVVTTLTSLSMAAICTNGEVRGGGAYYMISRSLGPEFGGAIGLIFSVANAVAVAMYVVGFAETVQELMKLHDVVLTTDLNDIRIIGCITVVLLLGIVFVGMEWEARAQMLYLVILLVAMVDFIVGAFIPPNADKQNKGISGLSAKTFTDNLKPGYRDSATFFQMFSIFFPAATGILAGANISGDLKNPQKAIPKGTLLAILLTTVSYIGFAMLVGAVAVRDASGTSNNYTECFPLRNGTKCEYGLMNSYGVMEIVSGFGPLIYAGIFSATLSSALASLVSAPKVFQALCKDEIFPYIKYFAKGYGKSDEPRRGYILSFVIALGFTVIGELNAIAPIISNFFLAAYALINFSCFHSSLVKSPGFRPAFRYYNLWLSLFASVLCVGVMFIINWWTALLTFAIVGGFYLYIHIKKPEVNWGSSTQAQLYQSALTSVTKLNQMQEHVKNYRPQILVLSGNPSHRPPLVDFCYNITKNISLLICGNVVNTPLSQRDRTAVTKEAFQWFGKRKIKAFYSMVENESFLKGTECLMQVSGIGKLKPNTLMMGFKCNWQNCSSDELLEYFNVIHSAFSMHLSVGVIRLQDGMDFSKVTGLEDIDVTINSEPNQSKMTHNESVGNLPYNDSSACLDHHNSTSRLSSDGSSRGSTPPPSPCMDQSIAVPNIQNVSTNPGGKISSERKLSSTKLMKGGNKDIPKEILSSVNQFHRKQEKGTLDVWWLFDDGGIQHIHYLNRSGKIHKYFMLNHALFSAGLTLLIPYLLTTRSYWGNCKLRIFSLANRKDELDREQRNMAALLSKFRIDYSDVIVCPDVNKKPQESSIREFNTLISKWRVDENEVEVGPCSISESEMLSLTDKTNRHLRLREMLLQHSKSANMIVMTLPMPRRGAVSAPMYMAWIETLTKDMPPILLIRGNQTSVLTFYS
ncbi:Solute carrier family 12 member 2 [Nymphon striatum]|nr:Solute carrier family 12 member 2 [Nymphon striatum]